MIDVRCSLKMVAHVIKQDELCVEKSVYVTQIWKDGHKEC